MDGQGCRSFDVDNLSKYNHLELHINLVQLVNLEDNFNYGRQ